MSAPFKTRNNVPDTIQLMGITLQLDAGSMIPDSYFAVVPKPRKNYRTSKFTDHQRSIILIAEKTGMPPSVKEVEGRPVDRLPAY